MRSITFYLNKVDFKKNYMHRGGKEGKTKKLEVFFIWVIECPWIELMRLQEWNANKLRVCGNEITYFAISCSLWDYIPTKQRPSLNELGSYCLEKF